MALSQAVVCRAHQSPLLSAHRDCPAQPEAAACLLLYLTDIMCECQVRKAVIDHTAKLLRADNALDISHIVLDLPCTFFMLRSLRCAAALSQPVSLLNIVTPHSSARQLQQPTRLHHWTILGVNQLRVCQRRKGIPCKESKRPKLLPCPLAATCGW